MFTNLIESNSHSREFQRRGSFFLITVAAYCLILSAAGVAGVLTYDATVEAQKNDVSLLNWIPPVTPTEHVGPAQEARAPRRLPPSSAPIDQHIKTPERIEQVPPVDDLRVTPQEIGVTGPTSPPADGPVRITDRNANPPSSGDDKNGCPTCNGPSTGVAVTPQPTPQPTPIQQPSVQRVSSVVMTSKIISLPKPNYPMMAKQIRAQGSVTVQILVDEKGNVISAHAVNGNPALTSAAEEAARRARFTPTKLNDQPVKVQGVITYNFVLQ
jgi:protein TonB